MSSWEKKKEKNKKKKTFICCRNFDVIGLIENLEMSQIYGVSMNKRIQTSYCDFTRFKTCKKKAKMPLTNQRHQRQVRHITSM